MTRPVHWRDVGWYGLGIAQYGAVTAGPVAIATRETSCAGRGSDQLTFALVPIDSGTPTSRSRIFTPLAKRETFVALTQDGPRTRTVTLTCSPRLAARSPTPKR